MECKRWRTEIKLDSRHSPSNRDFNPPLTSRWRVNAQGHQLTPPPQIQLDLHQFLNTLHTLRWDECFADEATPRPRTSTMPHTPPTPRPRTTTIPPTPKQYQNWRTNLHLHLPLTLRWRVSVGGGALATEDFPAVVGLLLVVVPEVPLAVDPMPLREPRRWADAWGATRTSIWGGGGGRVRE